MLFACVLFGGAWWAQARAERPFARRDGTSAPPILRKAWHHGTATIRFEQERRGSHFAIECRTTDAKGHITFTREGRARGRGAASRARAKNYRNGTAASAREDSDGTAATAKTDVALWRVPTALRGRAPTTVTPRRPIRQGKAKRDPDALRRAASFTPQTHERK